MPLPMLAGLAIGAGINALTNIFGAKKQADASQRAAQQQAQAVQQAMTMMNRAYSPYLTAGGQSMNVLGRLMSPSVPYTQPMQLADAQQYWPTQGAPTMAVPRMQSPLGRVMTRGRM